MPVIVKPFDNFRQGKAIDLIQLHQGLEILLHTVLVEGELPVDLFEAPNYCLGIRSVEVVKEFKLL